MGLGPLWGLHIRGSIMKTQNYNRRDILTASGVFAVAAVAASGPARAQSGHMHTMAGAMHKNNDLTTAAMDCLRKGNECLAHCLMLFQAKDTTVADCAVQVNQMLPMCDALAKLAMADSKYLKQHAKLCIDVCTDCEKECRKHEKTHPECKACADSCSDCIKACKALVG